jgi:peroxiredoxin
MRRRVAIHRIAGIVGFLLFAVCESEAHAGAVRVGDQLPAVTLSDWRGGTVDLAQQSRQVMIVDFWASWCQTCREALPRLDAITRRHAGKGLQVFAINVDKTTAKADEFLTAHLPTPAMTLLRDPDGTALARYGAAAMPALYVVDQNGVVRLLESGFTADGLRSVEQLIDALLRTDQP